MDIAFESIKKYGFYSHPPTYIFQEKHIFFWVWKSFKVRNFEAFPEQTIILRSGFPKLLKSLQTVHFEKDKKCYFFHPYRKEKIEENMIGNIEYTKIIPAVLIPEVRNSFSDEYRPK
jgi:hypothetical protein